MDGRSRCSVEMVFESLGQVVERDVEDRNEPTSELRGDYIFAANANGDATRPKLEVYRSPESDPIKMERLASLEQDTSRIKVMGQKKSGDLLGMPRWSDQAEFCLFVFNESQLKA